MGVGEAARRVGQPRRQDAARRAEAVRLAERRLGCEVVGRARGAEPAQHRELVALALVESETKQRAVVVHHDRERRALVAALGLGGVAFPTFLYGLVAAPPDEQVAAGDRVQRRLRDVDPDERDIGRQHAFAETLEEHRLVGALEPLGDDPLDDVVGLLRRHSFVDNQPRSGVFRELEGRSDYPL